jgi:hypothetical protein
LTTTGYDELLGPLAEVERGHIMTT